MIITILTILLALSVIFNIVLVHRLKKAKQLPVSATLKTENLCYTLTSSPNDSVDLWIHTP